MTAIVNGLGSFDMTSPHKRKRSLDYSFDKPFEHQSKRRPITSLPFRSSSSRSSLLSTSGLPQILTPEDEIESHSKYINTELDLWHNPSSISQPIHVNKPIDSHEETPDVEMANAPPRYRTGRARSNDILAPRMTDLLRPPTSIETDRMPTPITEGFDGHFLTSTPTSWHQFPSLRTNLSPMFEQETWISPEILPSPIENDNNDSMMIIEQTNDLRVSDNDEGGVSPSNRITTTRTIDREQPRTARLHMGFLSGCDKCIRKVPGHYSHILWS